MSIFKKKKKTENTNILAEEAMMTPFKTIMKNLIHNKTAVIGFIMFVGILLFSFGGSKLVPMSATFTCLTNGNLRPGTNYLSYPKELEGKNVKKVVSGISYSAAITDDGKFYIWGTECNLKQKNVSDYMLSVPKDVKNANIVDIQSGGNFLYAIADDNTIYSWGNYGNGQTEVSPEATMKLQQPGVGVKQILAATQWSALLTTDGNLYVWGSTQAKMNFLIKPSLQGHIVSAASGDANIVLVLDDGTVSVIGDRGTEFALNVPEELQDGSVQIIEAAATNRSVIARDVDGQLYIWGSSEDGLNKLPAELEGVDVVDIAAGYNDFVALSDAGQIYVWGDNNLHQKDVPATVQGKATNIYGGYYQFYATNEKGNMLGAWGNKGYIFGSDAYGRDILTRIIHGGRISLTVGAIAVVIELIIAIIIGLSSGYFGGWVDMLLMRVTDIFNAIPFYPIAVTLSYIIGNKISESARMYMIMVIMGCLSWMGLARLIRAQLLLEREKDFVLAAKALGVRESSIMFKHILPNIFNLVIVNITLGYASSLLSEAGLSFLGFGVTEPTPSWGNMLTSAQQATVIQYYWWRWIIPALFVIFAALSINMVGDALREAMDPRSNER